MTSRASISSLMRMAPSSAVNPAPTCAASVTPAISGVISRVLAKRRDEAGERLGADQLEALEPCEPDLRCR